MTSPSSIARAGRELIDLAGELSSALLTVVPHQSPLPAWCTSHSLAGTGAALWVSLIPI